MSTRGHEAYREEVGAYLLGALTDLERQAFERHLEGCVECRDEVERLRLAAEALPQSVEQFQPPPSLKASLMEVVEREAAERGGAVEEPRRPQWWRRFVPSPSGLRPVMVAGVLALGLLAGFGVAQLTGGEDERRTVVASVDKSRVPQASGGLQIEGDGKGGAILRVQGMPSLQPNRVYQAWVARDGTFVPQPTFEVGDTGGGAVAIPDDLSDAQQILVTREARGGARAPTEVPILAVPL